MPDSSAKRVVFAFVPAGRTYVDGDTGTVVNGASPPPPTSHSAVLRDHRPPRGACEVPDEKIIGLIAEKRWIPANEELAPNGFLHRFNGWYKVEGNRETRKLREDIYYPSTRQRAVRRHYTCVYEDGLLIAWSSE